MLRVMIAWAVGPGERWLARDHLVDHAAERVDVSSPVDVGGSAGLLGTHVLRRADRQAGPGDRLLVASHRPGDPEVGHHGVPIGDQDVGRLDVAVDEASLVGIGQRLGHLAPEAKGLAHRELLLAGKTRRKRLALDYRHHVVEDPLRRARIVHGEDVGVAQLGSDLHLAQEPLGAEGLGQLRTHHLDRHLPLVLEVLGQVDRGHPAFPEHVVDPVAIGQGLTDPRHLERPGRHRARRHSRFGGCRVAAIQAEMRLGRQRGVTRRTAADISGQRRFPVRARAGRMDRRNDRTAGDASAVQPAAARTPSSTAMLATASPSGVGAGIPASAAAPNASTISRY